MSNVNVQVNGRVITAGFRTFKSGSQGWYVNGKSAVSIPTGVTKDDFGLKMRPILVVIGGTTLTANPRMFSTGSVGWYANGKATIGGQKVQCGLNIIVAKSKDGVPTGECSVQVSGNLVVVKSKPGNTAPTTGDFGEVNTAPVEVPAAKRPEPKPAQDATFGVPPATVDGVTFDF